MTDPFAPAGAVSGPGPIQIMELEVIVRLKRDGVQPRDFVLGTMPVLDWDRRADLERRFLDLLQEGGATFVRERMR